MANITYDQFIEEFYSYSGIYKMIKGSDIFKEPDDKTSCDYPEAMKHHNVIVIGKNDLCEVLAVKIISHSPGYDNKLLDVNKLEKNTSAYSLFSKSQAYISSVTFYVKVESLNKYHIGHYDI